MNLKSNMLLPALSGLTVILTLFVVSCGGPGRVVLSSPDENITVSVMTGGGESGNELTYSVMFGETAIIRGGSLGINFAGSGSFGTNLNITSVKRSSGQETYKMQYGKQMPVQNKYTEMTLSLTDESRRTMDLVFRAYDDGVAFRYLIPRQDMSNDITIAGERTTFRFDSDYTYWGMHVPNYATSYEYNYTNTSLSQFEADSLAVLPFLVKVSDTAWAGVTEAALVDYAGMYVRGDDDDPYNLASQLSPLPDKPEIAVKATAPHKTPWRVIMLGDHPGRLIESNIIVNLNPPPTMNMSWVKPGKTAWDWWSGQIVEGMGFEGAMDNRTMKYYIDFAAETGLEYMLIDAGWYQNNGADWRDYEKLRDPVNDITKPIPEIDPPGLVKYANERGVDIILWIHWIPTMRQMDEAFPLYESWGVKGVKIDFMDRDDQEMVNMYHRMVKKAAEHHLVINFHGAYKPTGIRRTWPNLITREGVLGLEFVKFESYMRASSPGHDCTIPFTRMLAGPMDFTQGGFTNATKEQFVSRNRRPMTKGTRCHQLALYVIFESPLQMLPDHPANYRGKPGIEFLKAVPTTWDDTNVLNGAVGDFVTIARKNGEEWYLGSITDWTPRKLDVSLDFLGSGTWTAEIWADGSDSDINAESVAMKTVTVTADRTLTIDMGPGGGFAARFYPASSGK